MNQQDAIRKLQVILEIDETNNDTENNPIKEAEKSVDGRSIFEDFEDSTTDNENKTIAGEINMLTYKCHISNTNFNRILGIE